jgi:hypothetical protein
MNKYLLYLFVVFTQAEVTYCQNFWEPISPPGDSLHTSDIAVDSSGFIYISNSIGYVNYGGIYRSMDDGESWQLKGYANSSLLSVAVNPYNNDIYTGGFGKIYKSINQGDTWNISFSYYAFSILHFSFGYDSLIFAAAEEALIRSADYGNTWKIVLADSSTNYQEDFTDVAFSPDGIIYACSKTLYGGCGRIYQSLDLGNTWNVLGLCNHFFSLEIDNFGNLLTGGLGLERFNISTQTWETLLTDNYVVKDILVTPNNKLLVAAEHAGPTLGGFYMSDDNGQTFFQNNTGLNYNDLRRLAIDKHGRILANNTDVFRSFDTVVTGIRDLSINERSTLKCYPNPFSEYINLIIEKSIPGDGDFFLKVYDSFGKLVYNSPMKIGVPFKWEPYNLNPGLYYILAYNSKQRYTAKIIKTQ